MEVLQCEIFTLKKELDVERSKREKSKEETANIRKEVKHLNESFSYTIERLDSMDQEKLNCDVVLENLDADTEVRDVSQHVCNIVDNTLMGTTIDKTM